MSKLSIFPYLGGKISMLPNILPKIPPHSTYVEPFAGSLAVFLNKKPSEREIINDLDPDIATFWKVLKTDGDRLIYKIQMTPTSRSIFGNACDLLFRSEKKLSDVDRALYTYVAITQGIVRVLNPRNNDKNCSVYKEFHNYRVAKIDNLEVSFQDTKVFNQDAVKVMKRFDGKDTFMYLDPPYVVSSQRGSESYKISISDEWHEEFLQTALRCKSKIMISGYESEMYRDYLMAWECFKYPKHSNTSLFYINKNPKISVIKNDCLWVNYPCTPNSHD